MRLFGLIGYPLSHSFSEKYFTAKFSKERLPDCRYRLFPIDKIDKLPVLLNELQDLQGLNVTIPYKKLVLPYLDDASGIPSGIQACNCIAVRDGKLVGYNTDWKGFYTSLKPLLLPGDINALILGNGGATEAICYALSLLNIGYSIVSRQKTSEQHLTYDDLDESVMLSHTVIINTTPLGMYPQIDVCPQIPYQFITDRHLLFDLHYNPSKTLFLKKGEERGARIKNGEEMLIIQAEESWKIWNSRSVDGAHSL